MNDTTLYNIFILYNVGTKKTFNFFTNTVQIFHYNFQVTYILNIKIKKKCKEEALKRQVL